MTATGPVTHRRLGETERLRHLELLVRYLERWTSLHT
jgi:hypothetical protein